MLSETSKRILVFLMLGLLTASAFFMRLENFKNSKMRSIDEVVYYRMAKQILEEGPSGYHTMPYGKEMADSGRTLPDYFFKPLFKHPPVFTLLVSLSMKIFGTKMISAGYVPLIFGALMIPLVYLLATMVFDRNVGMLSAIFMWLDPVNIICSQKVWMETTLAFFMVLAVYLFIVGLKGRSDIFFVLGGLASGLAVLTKYSGILSLCIILLYASIFRREVFKNKYFCLGLVMPVALLSVWFYWNYLVYGAGFVIAQAEIHNIIRRPSRTFYLAVMLLGLVLFVFFRLIKFRKNADINSDESSAVNGIDIRRKIVIVIGMVLAILMHKQIIHGLHLNYFPATTWRQGFFRNVSSLFYVGRLIEFSALFIFAFAAFFINVSVNIEKKIIFFLSSSMILLFFMVWTSYQSRYILPAIPFLIILSIQFISELHHGVSKNNRQWVQFTGSLLLKLILIYIVIKTCYLNAAVSFPNDMCYF